MNWSAIKTALHTWVVAASGLDAQKVAWGQNMPALGKPWISMRVRMLGNNGLDWIEVDATDPDAPDYVALGARTMRLMLTAYSDTDFGAAAAVGLLEKTKTRALLPGIYGPLRAGKVGLAFPDPIVSHDGIVNFATFEPRAMLDVMVHLVSKEIEAATDDNPGYIQSADLVDDERDYTIHVDRDDPP